jgi:PAS domain S-box-containing protein
LNRAVAPPTEALTAAVVKARPDLAQLFEAMPGQYMILDRDLIYVEANPAYCASTERSREEIVGRYVFEAFPPTGEGGRQIEESLRRVLATGVAETLPLAAYPIPTPDGGFRMKYWSCAHLPLFDENGEVAFVAQNAVDVTELQNLKTIAYGPDPGAPARGESVLFRRALEITALNDSLAAETRGLRELFMQAPGFMAVLMGPELIYAQANSAYLQLIGHRPVVGLPLAEALPEVVAQGFRDLLLSVMRDRTPHIGRATSVMLQREPGAPLEERFLDFIFQPIAGSDGESVGVFIEGSDVTDRVLGEAALRRSEEQLRLATEVAEVGLWDVDGTTGALYWPPRVKAMFGISPDQPVTMDDFYAGLHPDDRETATAAYQAAANPDLRALYDVEYRTVGKEDGIVRWVAAKGRGVFDETGRCKRVIGTAIDITERKRAEQEKIIREREDAELREQFIAVLGHDLRNPLAAVAAGTHILVRRPEKAAEVAEQIERSISRMSELIDNVLDFARGRLGGGFVTARDSAKPLEPVLLHVIQELRGVHPDRSFVVEIDLREPVQCDRQRIGQLLSNLLGNALAYGAPNKPIDVRALADGGQFSLSVTNAGKAIEPTARERLFQPFFRGVRDRREGLGLGLYICSEIAKAHGGRIDVESEGGSTSFTLRMPTRA